MRKPGMNSYQVYLLLGLTALGAQPARAQLWQPPPGAKIYHQYPISEAGEKPLKVVVYSAGTSASATLLSAEGKELDSVRVDLNLSIQEPTGVFHLKNDDSWQIVLFGQVGAKAHEARVFDPRGGKLVQLFDWSGWSFRIVTLEGKQLIAAQLYQRRPPADLYLWRNGGFQKVNLEFPSFYAPSPN